MEESRHEPGIQHVRSRMIGTVIKINRHPVVNSSTIKNFLVIFRIKVA